MSKLESFELTDFNLEGHIALSKELGLLKILRSGDGRLILVTDNEYDKIDHEKPVVSKIANIDSLLGFVLDIGIQRERRLTYGDGFYFGQPLIPAQSRRRVNQKDFDADLIKRIEIAINGSFASGDNKRETDAIKLTYLFNAYNQSRLLFPNYYNDSYLGLLRILDALSLSKGSCEFAAFVASISHILNKKIYKKIAAISGYKSRLTKAEVVFYEQLKNADKKGWDCCELMKKFKKADRLIFACMFSAYQYRSKFVHQGIPFPEIVKEALYLEKGSGLAYLHPSVGLSFLKIYRPDGPTNGDVIDAHKVIADPKEVNDFKEKYFLLIPTWYFLKQITRQALINSLDELIL